MTSLEIISSSDEEPIFIRNQRLIQEHRVREEQQDTRDHFSRVLEEVKEGKRKFLRVAAFPESSSVPRAVPLDPSLSVSIAYEPSDLKYKIGSRSPPPVAIESRALKFKALQSKSTITNIDQISAILRKHDLKISFDLVV